jgi:peptidyl-prolyl cis-trans isomerase D
VPPQLIEPLFRLKQGEPTMVETLDGFTLAVLAETIEPDPAKDPAGYGKVRDQLDQSVAGDIQSVLTVALRNRATPQINKPVFDTIAQGSE